MFSVCYETITYLKKCLHGKFLLYKIQKHEVLQRDYFFTSIFQNKKYMVFVFIENIHKM